MQEGLCKTATQYILNPWYIALELKKKKKNYSQSVALPKSSSSSIFDASEYTVVLNSAFVQRLYKNQFIVLPIMFYCSILSKVLSFQVISWSLNHVDSLIFCLIYFTSLQKCTRLLSQDWETGKNKSCFCYLTEVTSQFVHIKTSGFPRKK